jgi:trehalose 6-phosphate synthase
VKSVSERAWYHHEHFPDRQIILGIDRLDYSKGILERLKAFRIALQTYPELCEKITLMQVVVPSRRNIARYAGLKKEIERLIGEINGEFTQSGWVPIHYMFRHLDQNELFAQYRTSEIALVTPLKDGMNLVAKEYCACNIEETGVLVLSEFAGVAAEFHKYALLVNPYDVDGIARAIHDAVSMEES